MFQELGCPKKDASGYWVAGTAEHLNYLLNDDRHDIGYIMDYSISEFFFDKEDTCHRQASEYYSRHGIAYPYMKEWSNIMWDVNMKLVEVEVESEIMRFE